MTRPAWSGEPADNVVPVVSPALLSEDTCHVTDVCVSAGFQKVFVAAVASSAQRQVRTVGMCHGAEGDLRLREGGG